MKNPFDNFGHPARRAKASGPALMSLEPSLVAAYAADMVSRIPSGLFEEHFPRTCLAVSSRATAMFVRPLRNPSPKHRLAGRELFAKSKSTDTGCIQRPVLTVSDDRNAATVRFDAIRAEYISSKRVHATHFRFNLGIIAVSALDFDEEVCRYRPADPSVHGLHAFQCSQPLPMYGETIQPLDISATLPYTSCLPDNCALLVILGSELLQEVCGSYSTMVTGSAMRIIGLF